MWTPSQHALDGPDVCVVRCHEVGRVTPRGVEDTCQTTRVLVHEAANVIFDTVHDGVRISLFVFCVWCAVDALPPTSTITTLHVRPITQYTFDRMMFCKNGSPGYWATYA